MRAPARRSSDVLPGLDTLRLVGALLVLTTHVAFWSGSYSFAFWGTALARLDVGVAIFFVLSGFLLARPYLERGRTGRPMPGTRSYLRKRAIRVLPVYWISAVLAMAFLADNADAGVLGWLRALTLTDIYFSSQLPAGLTQTWSLATEIAFYLLLPLVMIGWNRATRGRRSDGVVLAIVAAAAAVCAVWVLSTPAWLEEHAPLYLLWLPTYGVWFVIGIALSHLHQQVTAARAVGREPASGLLGWLVRLGEQPGVCWTIAVSVFLAASTVLAGPPLLAPASPSQLLSKTMMYAVVGGLLVLTTAFADQRGLYASVMATPVLRHLGHISYGIFCIHILVLHLLTYVTGWEPFTGHGWSLFFLTLLLSVVGAEALHFLVERPLARLRGKGAPPAVSVESDAEPFSGIR